MPSHKPWGFHGDELGIDGLTAAKNHVDSCWGWLLSILLLMTQRYHWYLNSPNEVSPPFVGLLTIQQILRKSCGETPIPSSVLVDQSVYPHLTILNYDWHIPHEITIPWLITILADHCGTYVPIEQNPSLLNISQQWPLQCMEHIYIIIYTCIHTYILYLPIYLPTCLPAYMPTCLPTYLHNYLPTYLPTYIYINIY